MKAFQDMFIFQRYIGTVNLENLREIDINTKDGIHVGIIETSIAIDNAGILNAICNSTQDKFFEHKDSISCVATKCGDSLILIKFKLVQLEDKFNKDKFREGLESEYFVSFFRDKFSEHSFYNFYKVDCEDDSMIIVYNGLATYIKVEYLGDRDIFKDPTDLLSASKKITDHVVREFIDLGICGVIDQYKEYTTTILDRNCNQRFVSHKGGTFMLTFTPIDIKESPYEDVSAHDSVNSNIQYIVEDSPEVDIEERKKRLPQELRSILHINAKHNKE